MRDRAQGFHCEVKGPSGIPRAGEGWKTLTPKHQPRPEKPSPRLGKRKASVCHLDRNKLESQTLKKKDQKEKKKTQARSSKKRAVAKHQVAAGSSLPPPWAASKAPSSKLLPSRETTLEQAMEQRAQPFPKAAGFSSRGETRPLWEVWEHLQAS